MYINNDKKYTISSELDLFASHAKNIRTAEIIIVFTNILIFIKNSDTETSAGYVFIIFIIYGISLMPLFTTSSPFLNITEEK